MNSCVISNTEIPPTVSIAALGKWFVIWLLNVEAKAYNLGLDVFHLHFINLKESSMKLLKYGFLGFDCSPKGSDLLSFGKEPVIYILKSLSNATQQQFYI
jgi:hypothetical protein